MDYEGLLKRYRRTPLFHTDALPDRLDLGVEDIQRIIPHRDPFLLLDRLTGIDLAGGRISGERWIAGDDPVFLGHFPGFPIYPGVLELEMVGQLGLCLHYFLQRQSTSISQDARPVAVRATRLVGAYYQEPLLPDTKVSLMVKLLDNDGFFATIVGQAMVAGSVACVVIHEGCLLDDSS